MSTQTTPRLASRESNLEFLPFALPDIGEDEISEVVDTLRSGWLTTGPKTKRFEEDFAAFMGGEVKALAVNSGTSALHLALESFGVGPGDEVITSPFTFTATAEVVRYLGADPVFSDIDPSTLNIDPSCIAARIGARTKAVLPVHFGGLACDIPAILGIARKHGLSVLEDAAHALPATCFGKLVGALETDAAAFSFYATKTVATGEGGMLTASRREISDRCRMMRLHGIDRDVFNRYVSTRPAWHYEIVAPGFKYNMTDMAASIGIHQLRRAWALQGVRARIAARYDAELSGLPVALPPHPREGDVHSWHLYVIRLRPDSPVSRDNFITEMARQGVGTSVHFIPLHLQPYWRDRYNLKPEDFPEATRAFQSVVSLPIYTRMTESDQERVIRAVRQVLSRGSRSGSGPSH